MTNDKRFQRHFRKFHDKKTTFHPQYVYDETGKDYKVVGVTGAPVTKGVKNIPLNKNPEPDNPRKAYLRPSPDVINKGVRNEKLKGWKFSDADKPKVEAVIRSGKPKKRK